MCLLWLILGLLLLSHVIVWTGLPWMLLVMGIHRRRCWDLMGSLACSTGTFLHVVLWLSLGLGQRQSCHVVMFHESQSWLMQVFSLEGTFIGMLLVWMLPFQKLMLLMPSRCLQWNCWILASLHLLSLSVLLNQNPSSDKETWECTQLVGLSWT